MDRSDPSEAPTAYGVPLYMCCFSSLALTVVEGTGLAAADSNGTSDPFAVIDLVDVGSKKEEQEQLMVRKSFDNDNNDDDDADDDADDAPTTMTTKTPPMLRAHWQHQSLGGRALHREHTLMPGRDIPENDASVKPNRTSQMQSVRAKKSSNRLSVRMSAISTDEEEHLEDLSMTFDTDASGPPAKKSNAFVPLHRRPPSLRNPRPLSRTLWKHRTATIALRLDGDAHPSPAKDGALRRCV